MTAPTLDLEIPAGERTIAFQRFVKAPPALLFEVMTTPEHLRNWWGPRSTRLVVDTYDLRVGGAWRFVDRAPDGQEFAFHGEFREIDAPLRIVQTFVYEGAPDHEAVETLTLEAVDGGTILHGHVVHDTVEARDAHVDAGMEGGMRESYDRIDEVVAALQA